MLVKFIYLQLVLWPLTLYSMSKRPFRDPKVWYIGVRFFNRYFELRRLNWPCLLSNTFVNSIFPLWKWESMGEGKIDFVQVTLVQMRAMYIGWPFLTLVGNRLTYMTIIGRKLFNSKLHGNWVFEEKSWQKYDSLSNSFLLRAKMFSNVKLVLHIC